MMSARQPDAQGTLSLPVLRGQHADEPPVERLQYLLNFVAGSNLDVDGLFGPKTEGGPGFQQDENLSVDGIVGRQTWTALLRRWLLFWLPG